MVGNGQHPAAEKVDSKYFKRFYKISDSVYRSEQPSKKAFAQLEGKGFKTILNLRRLKDDNRKARHTNLQLEHLRFKSKELSEENLIDALRIIKDAQKPILIHCWHGSDRTGAVIAAYRIIYQNWSKTEAIAELNLPEFGHHAEWYPNIVELLENLDIERIKKAVNSKVN